MNNQPDTAPSAPSLRSLRVVATIGGLVAGAAVVVAFRFGLLYGLLALFAFPVIPLGFVLAFEGIHGLRG